LIDFEAFYDFGISWHESRKMLVMRIDSLVRRSRIGEAHEDHGEMKSIPLRSQEQSKLPVEVPSGVTLASQFVRPHSQGAPLPLPSR